MTLVFERKLQHALTGLAPQLAGLPTRRRWTKVAAALVTPYAYALAMALTLDLVQVLPAQHAPGKPGGL